MGTASHSLKTCSSKPSANLKGSGGESGARRARVTDLSVSHNRVDRCNRCSVSLEAVPAASRNKKSNG